MELQDVILRILDREHTTTLLVTHDVDEALYMSDRVCMMTSGPRAGIGQMIDLPFARPRVRQDVLEDELYYDFRGALVSFLEQQDMRTGIRADRMAARETEAIVSTLTDSALSINLANETVEASGELEPAAAG